MNTKISYNISLLKKLNLIGFKRSFEDEGASSEIVKKTKTLATKNKLIISLKIGGCEAIRDLINAKKIKVDVIVAPMIESNFALQKYIDSSNKVFSSDKIKRFINIETKNAAKNLSNILDPKNSKYLDGVVVGRSDLESSYKKINKQDLNTIVLKIFSSIKRLNPNLKIGMGGKINDNDAIFIKKAFNLKVLDFIETRNIIVKLNKKNINKMKLIINLALKLENEINYHLNKNSKNKNFEYKKRLKTVGNRLNKF